MSVTSHTTVMIDRNTLMTVQLLAGGQVELTFGEGGVYDPETSTSVTLLIADPLTTISNLVAALQQGYVAAHHHKPDLEQPPSREKAGHEPPGAYRHMRSI